MTLPAVRKAIANHYRSELSGVEIVEHGGPFSLEDLQRVAARAPAAIIACLGIQSVEFLANTVIADCAWGVFALTKNKQRNRRDAEALLLVEAILVEIPTQRWDATAYGASRNLAASNLYSVKLDKLGMSMWSVRWNQQIEFTSKLLTNLDAFETFFGTYDIGETPDTEATEDQVELPQ